MTEIEGASPGMVVVLPGSQATAGVFGEKPGDEHLAMMMDPFNLFLTLPDNRQDWVDTARFLRELAHSSTLLADRIDPEGVGQPTWAPLGSVKRHE